MKNILLGKFLDVTAVSEITGLSEQMVRRYILHGKLRARKIGKKWFSKKNEVLDFMEQGTQRVSDFSPTPKVRNIVRKLFQGDYEIMLSLPDPKRPYRLFSISRLLVCCAHQLESIDTKNLWNVMYSLKPDGQVCLLVPRNFLDSPRLQHLRDYLTSVADVLAIIEVQCTVFTGSNMQGAFIILQKKPRNKHVFIAEGSNLDEIKKLVDAYHSGCGASDKYYWANTLKNRWTFRYNQPREKLLQDKSIALEDVATVETGFAMGWKVKKKDKTQTYNVPYIGVKQIESSQARMPKDTTTITIPKDKYEKFMVKQDDIIINILGSFGAVHITKELAGACFSNLLVRIRAKPNWHINYKGLVDHLNTEGQNYFNSVSIGARVKRITLSDLRKMPINKDLLQEEKGVKTTK